MTAWRHLRATREAWRAESARRRDDRTEFVETEFLPAALEVSETPPSPVGRLILWLILLAAVLALGWAFLAKVDTVVAAEGRLVPTGRLRTVEASDSGVVRQIAVREGDQVHAGQVLVALDATVAQADVAQAETELQTAALARARAQALLQGGRLAAPPSAGSPAVQAEQQAVDARRRELESKVAGLQERRSAAEATVRVSEANIQKIVQTLPLAQRQVDAFQTLADKGYGARLRVDQERERFLNLKNELVAEQARRDEARAQSAALAREITQAEAEFRGQAAKERAEAEGAVATRQDELRKAQQRSRLQTLVAPVDGTVQEVAVTTLGQVAEAGKPLVTIVPRGEPLVAEVMILNRDIAEVRPGASAVIKLEAFPFNRNGVLKGVVTHMSADSIVDEKRGLVFPATIAISADRDPRAAAIRPAAGMSATVEIVTGRRRVIDYLWSPVSRTIREAGREK